VIPAAKVSRISPSTSSPIGSLQMMERTQYACEYNPCLQLLFECKHHRYYKSVKEYFDSDFENRLLEHENDILYTKRYDNSTALLYMNYFYIQLYKTFIATKVSAMNCRVLTIN